MALVRSVAEFENEIGVQIDQGNLDAALRKIRRVVDQIYSEPINTARVFGSKLLDELCQRIGAANWCRLQQEASSRPNVGKDADEPRTVVYVASRLYASGGHTAALADVIRLSPPARSVILVTGVAGATDHAAVQRRFESISNACFEYAPRGSYVEKLSWLQKRLMALSPESVWLFNHYQDSVAVAAVQPNAGYRLRYYHHGDHHLCLGVYLGYAEHIDMHPMGYHNCREKLGIKGSRYLPLVAKDLGIRPAAMSYLSGPGPTTCTAASADKLEMPYPFRYVDVVPELLRTSGGKHIHIGRLTPLALSRIRNGLRRLGIPRSAFVHIPYVPSVWKALHEYRVDLYVTSFPYGGARTLVEVMGAGVPVALHVHHSSRLLCTYDMAYEETLKWRSPQELYKIVLSIDAEELQRQGRLARRRYEEQFREEMLAEALNAKSQATQAPPLQHGYVNDEFQEALDISNQVSCVGALWRFFKRAHQQWKSVA
jgi:hypothetical protein